MRETRSTAAAVTPSQTIGPFFHEALAWACTSAAPGPGDSRVEGVVVDGNGEPVGDALLEVWQPGGQAISGADAGGGRPAVGFQRVPTDAAGRFAFTVARAPDSPAVAHVTVFARGLQRCLRTRLYLDAAVHHLAEVDGLRDVPPLALATLLATAVDGGYRWDIRLQGDGETLFLEFI